MQLLIYSFFFLSLLLSWFGNWQPFWDLLFNPLYSFKVKLLGLGGAQLFVFVVAIILSFILCKTLCRKKNLKLPYSFILFSPFILFVIFSQYFLELSILLLIVSVWIFAGLFIIQKIALFRDLDGAEKLLLSMGISSILHIEIYTVLGIVQSITPITVFISIIPFIFFSLLFLYKNLLSIKHFILQTWNLKLDSIKFSSILTLFYSLLMVFLIFQATLLPESRTDALSTHLYIPKILLRDKGFVNVSDTETSNLMPIGASMLFFPGVVINSTALAKLFVFSLFITICFVIFLFAKYRIIIRSRLEAIYAVGIITSTHVISWNASTAYADIPATFYYISGLYFFCKYFKERYRSYAISAAIFLSSSMLFKYQLWFYAFILIIVGGFYLFLKPHKNLFNHAILGLLMGTIIVLPLLIKNQIVGKRLLQFGISTPVQILRSSTIYLGTEKDTLSILRAPWDIFTASYGNGYGGISGIIFLLFFPIIVLFTLKKGGDSIFLLLPHICVFLFWLYGGVQDVRYIIPIFIVFSLFIAHIANQSFFFRLLFFASIFLNFPYFPNHYPYALTPYPYPEIFWDRSKEEGYKKATVPSYSAFTQTNHYLKDKPQSKILIINESHYYYLDVKQASLSTSDGNLFENTTDEQALTLFIDRGFTHLYTSKTGIYPPVFEERASTFLKHFKPVISTPYGVLYEL